MTAVPEGPCSNWITWEQIGDYCTPATIESEAVQAAILLNVTRTLWKRSCRQFGLCTITRARVAPRCTHGYSWSAGYGWVTSGAMAGRGCRCTSYAYIDLGDEPVASVEGVWIDGVELAADAYRVDDWRRLVRTDGEGWPGSSLQPDEGGEPTIDVSWTYGVAVPADGVMCAALLACKMSHDVLDDCSADPSDMTGKVAEGVTITINPTAGDTGIALVERWLDGFQCGGGRIFDPGAHRKFSRIGT